jgi:hypothetical protein
MVNKEIKQADWWYVRKAVLTYVKAWGHVYLEKVIKGTGLGRSTVLKALKELVQEDVIHGVEASRLDYIKDERIANMYWPSRGYPKPREVHKNLAFPSVMGELMLCGVKVLQLKADESSTCYYHPEHISDVAGVKRLISARAVCHVGLESRAYDDAGYIVPKWTVQKIVFWNVAGQTGGLADIACKTLFPEREISLSANLNTYQGFVFDKGKQVFHKQQKDKPMTVRKSHFTCRPDSLMLGDAPPELEKFLAEIITTEYKLGDKHYGYAIVQEG